MSPSLSNACPDGKAISQEAVTIVDEELEAQMRQVLDRGGRAVIPLENEAHWLVRVFLGGEPNWSYCPQLRGGPRGRVYSVLNEVLGTEAMAGIPLRAGRQRLGDLVFALPRGHRWTEEDKELLLAFADQAALALAKLRSLEELRSLKEFNERLIRSMTEGVALNDPEGVIIYANPAFGELVGLAPEQIVGRHWTEFVPKEHRQRVTEALARRREGKVDRYRLELLRVDGRRVPVLVSGGPRFEEGRFVGTQGVFTDITPLAEAEARLQRALEQTERLLSGAVTAAVRIIEKRDPYVADHSQRVAKLACAIARELGLAKERIEGLRMAAMLHDIGKVAIPAEILAKPGRLSETEFKLVQAHPQVAVDTLADIDFPWPVREIILQHHERLDGSGYPQGLTGGDILLEARILGVADVVEAMAHHRPYRPALGIEAALQELDRGKGTLYDPRVVDACLRLFREQGFSWD
jgi:PAS domain S-box-containing protein/putative nucleotidyltransferase with HDIG domain